MNSSQSESLLSSNTRMTRGSTRLQQNSAATDGNNARVQVEVRNFLAGDVNSPFSEDSELIPCTTSEQNAEKLRAALNSGLKTTSPREHGVSNMLYALQASLSSIHRKHPRKQPTIHQLMEIYASRQCQSIVQSITGYARDQSTPAATTNPNGNDAEAILSILGSRTNESYQLGIIFPNWIMNCLAVMVGAPKSQGDGEKAAKMVWIYNDNISDVELGALDQWSGLSNIPADKTHLVAGYDEADASESDTRSESGSEWAEDSNSEFGDDLDADNSDFEDDSFNGSKSQDSRNRGSLPNVMGTSQRVRSDKTYTYRESIPMAPPANSQLPFDLMDGITSEELLTFFPNHALHWPAIVVRLMTDGWTYARIAKHINFHRTQLSPPAGQWVKANSIRATIITGAEQFFQRNLRTEQKQQSIRKSKRAKVVIPAASRAQLEQTAWRPSSNTTASESLLEQQWSLSMLGQAWKGSPRGFPQGIPGDGPFAQRVRDAVQTTLNGKPDQFIGAATHLQEQSNPPALPSNWTPNSYAETATARQPARSRDVSRLAPAREQESSALLGVRGKLYTMDDLDANIRHNAKAIIEQAPNKINGEVLLWIISKNGGKLTTEDLHRQLCASLKRQGEQKGPDRSTLSKRKTVALRERAKRNGTPYKTEFRNYEQGNAKKPRALRRPSQTPVTTFSANSRRRSTRSSSNNVPVATSQTLALEPNLPTIDEFSTIDQSQVTDWYEDLPYQTIDPAMIDPSLENHTIGFGHLGMFDPGFTSYSTFQSDTADLDNYLNQASFVPPPQVSNSQAQISLGEPVVQDTSSVDPLSGDGMRYDSDLFYGCDEL